MRLLLKLSPLMILLSSVSSRAITADVAEEHLGASHGAAYEIARALLASDIRQSDTAPASSAQGGDRDSENLSVEALSKKLEDVLDSGPMRKLLKELMGSKEAEVEEADTKAEAAAIAERYELLLPKEGASEAEALELAKKRAEFLYGKEYGFIRVETVAAVGGEPKLDVRTLPDFRDEKINRKFLYLKARGDGACCFHSLGVSRTELLERLAQYVRKMEAQPKVDVAIQEEYNFIRQFLNGYKHALVTKDQPAFKGADFSDKEARLSKFSKSLGVSVTLRSDFERVTSSVMGALLQEQKKEAPDWEAALGKFNELEIEFKKVAEALEEARLYREFLDLTAEGVWNEITRDNGTLNKIQAFLRETDHLKELEDDGTPKKLMSPEWAPVEFYIDDIRPYLGELQKQKKVNLTLTQVSDVNFRMRFHRAEAVDKIRMLRQYYGESSDTLYSDGTRETGRGKWLEPNSLLGVAHHLGLRFVSVEPSSRNTGGRTLVMPSSNADDKDATIPLRYIYRVGAGHYDMLMPVYPKDIDNVGRS